MVIPKVIPARHLLFHRSVIPVSSWFRIPEQGMKEYEFLSKGTAFCVKQSSSGSPIIATCSHVIAPYKWPKQFREPWLQFVKDAHVKCRFNVMKVNIINDDEVKIFNVVVEVDVQRSIKFHPRLDLCSFHLDCEAYEDESERGILDYLKPLELRQDCLVEGEKLEFLGFPVHSSLDDSTNDVTSKTSMEHFHSVEGKALTVVDSEGRKYARTQERLSVGMSGGPVLDAAHRCCGIFQGILPPPNMEEEGTTVDAVLRPYQEDAWELHGGFIPFDRI